jgi:hypothetical protein
MGNDITKAPDDAIASLHSTVDALEAVKRLARDGRNTGALRAMFVSTDPVVTAAPKSPALAQRTKLPLPSPGA